MMARRCLARALLGAGAVLLPALAWSQATSQATQPAQSLQSSPQATAAEPLPVVATFNLLADIVEQVGGDAVQVRSLVAAGTDVHVFEPGPNHARQLAGARLVVSNGLGFEGWIDRLVRSSGYRGPVIVATRGIEPLRDVHDHGQDRAGHRHDGSVDPHAWQSVPNMKRYVANIADGLCAVGPAGCAAFRANARRYLARLDELDRDIRAMLAPIPPQSRKVITSHRAFAYYAREYDVRFLAPVGLSTEVEPSAAAIGRLIRQIREEKVTAFFVEGISDARLIERIRAETGGASLGTLYSDSLSGGDGPAPSYEAMMRLNTKVITAALSAPAAVPPARR
jgi:zinc/manganese transport system substrate-binding protein